MTMFLISTMSLTLLTLGLSTLADSSTSSTSFSTPTTFDVRSFYVNLRQGATKIDPHVMVDQALPVQFMWGFECGNTGTQQCAQTSYRLQVFGSVDTGFTSSGNQTHMLPADTFSSEPKRYVWQVQANVSGTLITSANYTFFTTTNWNNQSVNAAVPIWAPVNMSHMVPSFVFLRTSVASDRSKPNTAMSTHQTQIPDGQTIVSALAFVTANSPAALRATAKPPTKLNRPPKILATYKLWVDGNVVGAGPGRGRCSPHITCDGPYGKNEQVFDGYDITDMVASKTNFDIFITGYGQPFPDNNPKVLIEIHLELADASGNVTPLVITSSPSKWQAYNADPVFNPGSNSGCAWYFYPKENFNASLVPANTPWSNPNRVFSADNNWQPAAAQSSFVALLVSKPTAPILILEQPSATINVTEIAPGSFFVDLGREIQGGIRLKYTGSATVQVQVTVAEELTHPNTIMFPPRTTTSPQVSWTLDAKTTTMVEHHEYFEWRYASLNFSTSVALADFEVSAWIVKLPYDESQAAIMSTSSSDLNAVWEMCRYTIEAGTLDVYSDSNARQRSADCAADDVTAIQGQYATSSQLSMQKFAIQQLLANGQASRVDWSILPIIAIYYHVMHTGEMEMANEQFEYLLNTLSNISSIGKSGLSEDTAALVDWPPGMEDGYVASPMSTVSSAWVYYGADTLAKIATILGRESDAAHVAQIAADLKATMNAKQWNTEKGAFCDGVCADTPHMSFHATMYTLAFGAASDENQLRAWQYLRSRINPPFSDEELQAQYNELGNATEDNYHWPPPPPSKGQGMPCGVYPSQYVLTALYTNLADKGNSALRVMTSNATNTWVAMLQKGATMTMEMWSQDEKPNLTWSHPWASSPGFIIAWFLFGIRPLTPGFGSISIKPQPGDLTKGDYLLPTIKGAISVSFTNSKTQFQLQVTVPPTSLARVSVPLPKQTHAAHTVGARIRLVHNGIFINASHVEGGFAVVEVLGGTHNITTNDAFLV